MKGRDFLHSKWCEKAADPAVQRELKTAVKKWMLKVHETGLLSQVGRMYRFFLSPEISPAQKILVGGALLYVITPFDLVPDMIPVVGWLDDIGVAAFALRYIEAQMAGMAESNPASKGGKSKSLEDILGEEIDGTTLDGPPSQGTNRRV